MLTECPHCLSVLKVSAELIYAGDPRVRCGECLRVFSARDHLTQADADLDTTRIYQPSKTSTSLLEGPQFSLKPEVAEGLRAIVDKPRKQPAQSKSMGVIQAKAQDKATTAPPNIERTRRAAIPSRSTDVHPSPEKATALAPSVAEQAATPNAVPSNKVEAYKDRHISVLERNVTVGRNAPFRSWSVVTFLFLAALTLLAVNTVRNVMSDPDLSQKLSNLWCNISACQATVSRDFSQLQIVRRKIYAHPNADGVLVISLAMINRLDRAMEYPTLQVRMTDQNGEVIARGHFDPQHYVPGFELGMRIEPERVVDVVLQVEDPGEAAQSFDLEFK